MNHGDGMRRPVGPAARVMKVVVGLCILAVTAPAYAGEAQDKALGDTIIVGGIAGALLPGRRQDGRPTEIIPRGSWIYDILSSLAAEGAFPYGPEYFHGAHLLTRGEVASLIAPLLSSTPSPAARTAAPAPAPPPAPASPDNAAPGTTAPGAPTEAAPAAAGAAAGGSGLSATPGLITTIDVAYDARTVLLKWEFRYELKLIGVDISGLNQPTSVDAADGGYARAQLALTRNKLHPRLMARGHVDGTWNSFQYTASFGNINPGAFERPFELSSIAPGPVTGARRQLGYDGDSLYLRGLDRAAISRTFSGWRLELGRDWLQWGPEYSGSLILSDNAGPLDMFLVSKDFDLGHFGTFRLHQFAALDQEPGAERYLLGRRIEKTLAGGLETAVSETLVTQGKPNPFDFVLPFYVVEHAQIKHDTKVDALQNYLIDFQLAYNDKKQRRYYGDILIDDITLPWSFQGQFYAPRSAGFLGGLQIPILHGPLEKFLLEAVYTDGVSPTHATYLHANPIIAYARYGNVIGNPIGPDSRGIVARLDLAPCHGWSTFAQATVEQHHRHSHNPDSETAILLSGSRQIKPGYSFVASAKPVWVTNAGTAGTPGSRLEAQVYLSAQF